MGDKFQFEELVYSYYDASIPTLSLTIDGCPFRWLQGPHLSSAHGHLGIFLLSALNRGKVQDILGGRGSGRVGVFPAHQTAQLAKGLDEEVIHLPPGCGLESIG